jgi:hypothetical protein
VNKREEKDYDFDYDYYTRRNPMITTLHVEEKEEKKRKNVGQFMPIFVNMTC